MDYRVGICDLTYAEMSSNGTVETRIEEAEQAASNSWIDRPDESGIAGSGLICDCTVISNELRKKFGNLSLESCLLPIGRIGIPIILPAGLVQEAVFNAKLRKYLPESDL